MVKGSEGFRVSFLLNNEQEKWSKEFYNKLPKKIRKLIKRYYVILNYSPKNYPDKDEIAYFIKPNLIEFNPRYHSNLIKKEFFIRALSHEIGHFYEYTLNPIVKWTYYKIFRYDTETLANYFANKFISLPPHLSYHNRFSHVEYL